MARNRKSSERSGRKSSKARAGGKGKRAASKHAPRRSGLARQAAYWGAVAAIWITLIVTGLVVVFSFTLPDNVVASLDKRPPNLSIVAADGTVLAERGLRRGHIRLHQLPPHLVDAVIATEDRRFRYHFGVDPIGLARAAFHNFRAGTVVQGGSTITQQLAKNLFLKPDRTVARKFREIILATWLETRFTKDQILELYLNRVYFGAGAYGVEAAARRYFSKSARKVTLAEAALLAGLLKAPSRYAPTKSMRRAEERAAVVLTSMVDAGKLAPEKAMAALAAPAPLRNPNGITGYEYAVDWAVEQLSGFAGEQETDLIVETTIDARLQRRVQEAVRSAMSRGQAAARGDEAAVVVLDTNGAVKALIGGRSYRDSQFNRAVKALRQPGSAFKPFVYLAALEAGMTPDTIVEDRPVSINGWRPKNYKGRYLGRVTLRDALAKSANTAAVRLTMEVGRRKVVHTARRLGITAPLHTRPSIALGTAEVTLLELTSSYVPMANGGTGVLPHIIKRVRTAKGKVLYRRRSSGLGRMMTRRHVGGMNDMLSATIARGTGRQAALPGRPAAGKTGTSQNSRDAWFVGYTANYVAGVWVGNDDGRSMRNVTGGGLPARIWKTAMSEAHKGVAAAALPGSRKWGSPDYPSRGRFASDRDTPFFRRLFGVFAPGS